MQKVLDENLTVLAKIYEMNIVKKEPIWFSKLVELFDGKLSRVQISKALDPEPSPSYLNLICPLLLLDGVLPI